MTSVRDPVPAADPRLAGLRQLRRVGILIAGTTIIVFGIIIAPLPGPGFTVFAPIGFAMLASEFLWAKRIINRVRDRTGPIERFGDKLAAGVPRWAGLLVMLGYWTIVAALAAYNLVNPRWLFPVAGVLFAPIGFWCWRVFELQKRKSSDG